MNNPVLFVRLERGELSSWRLEKAFQFYGKVKRCDVLPPRPHATAKAFVEYFSSVDAKNAKHFLDNTVIDNVPIRVFWAREPPRNSWTANKLPAGVRKQTPPVYPDYERREFR